jgi:5-methylcytosine-specific restriction endonuclease McrA
VVKYRWSAAERAAIFSVHGEKCYLCSKPVILKTMEVDHIIPETLLAKPEELRRVLALLGRLPTFEVNSFENWLPACRTCNWREARHCV